MKNIQNRKKNKENLQTDYDLLRQKSPLQFCGKHV